MTLAVVLPEAQPRRHQSAVRRWRAVNQPHTTGVVSRGRQFPLRLPLASQVTRNTYLNERHHAARVDRDGKTWMNGGADARFELRHEAALPPQPRWQFRHPSGSATYPRPGGRPA